MAEENKKLSGPRPGFMLGNLKQIGPKAHITWTKWSSMYGPIYRVHLGPLGESIVLSNSDLFKKAFEENPDAFSGRFVLPIVKKSGSEGTMTWENDYVFDKRRNLAIAVLGKADLDRLMQEEVTAFCDVLSKRDSKTDVYQLIYEANLNMTVGFCFQRCQRLSYDDPTFRERVKLLDDVLMARRNLMAEPGNMMPCFWSTCKYSGFRRVHKNLQMHIDKELTERDSSQITTVQDIMDGYLAKVDGIEFPIKDCIPHTMNLMGATITLKNALQWLLLIITKHPDVQSKIQNEITAVFEEKTPTADDIDKLPYTNASIYETLRIACPASQVVPHATLKDVNFEGYNIKRGTVVFGNIWGLHHTSEYWDDPDKFNPDRFLDSEGKLDLKKDSFVPFGLGKRRCPGEQFAKKVMFLFIASIYQRYGFEEVEGEPLPDIEDGVLYAGLHNPPPFKLRIVVR